METAEEKRASSSKEELAPFTVIKHALAKQFEHMKSHQLFRVDLSGPQGELLGPDMRRAATGDKLWEVYLAAFPEGTNPIYRERTDHDCSCCKNFIRTMGGVVAVIEGYVVSLWNFEPTGTFYDEVAAAMDHVVRSAPIENIFLHTEAVVGTEKSFQQVAKIDGSDPKTISWEHFHLRLPATAILKKDAIGPKLFEVRSTYDVFKRGLEELTLEAVDTVLELVAQNSLYRGAEYKGLLEAFRKEKVAYGVLTDSVASSHYEADANAMFEVSLAMYRSLFIWPSTAGDAVKRIRNTAIGTLLIDLSAGIELEDAVKKFETSIMAPSNYKRPTALVSKAQIEKARKTIEELGLTSALERRYATIDDITINNILFANRNAKKALRTNVFDDLARKVPEKIKNLDRVEEVPIEKFLSDIVPKADSIEVLVENRHAGNLVSLIAPVDPAAKSMFKWPNKFSWSYAGDVADSIKERVKAAGGSVVGDLCCRLAWEYTDDLDFHMCEPGYEIFYANRFTTSPSGGRLDVDANGGSGMMAHPVENIFYTTKAKMKEGVYELAVHNYSRRSTGVGFEVEVEFDGTTHRFVYDRVVRHNETLTVAKIQYSKKDGFKILESLPSSIATKKVWNVDTQTFQKVNVLMLSPNYWDNGERLAEIGGSRKGSTDLFRRPINIGNKHYFFMLEGCLNEEKARGFYNEMLSQELEPHRKTMEMVGAKMRTDESDRQLSGLGFSSTQRNSVLCRVNGTFQRIVKVVF